MQAILETKSYFDDDDDDDDTQNYLVFQPIYKYLKATGVFDNVSSWESKGFSNEKIKSFTVSDSSTALQLAYPEDRIMVKFEGDCLK